MSDRPVEFSSQSLRRPRGRTMRRAGLLAGGLVVALVVVLAWIDGGERALRPITEEIELDLADTAGLQQ
ncbi:MAG: hypothetical protein ACXIT4_10735 [Erythrobacter sp.]